MKKLINKILNYFNGNKTLFCMVVLYALTLETTKELINNDIIKIIEYIFLTFGGLSLGHKVKKSLK